MTSRSDSPERALLELAAHDLRNPLSGVLTATQLLIEEASRVLSPDQLILLRSIESSTQFMLRLVDDMAELPQFGAGKAKLDLRAVEVGSLVEHVVAASRPLAESRTISIGLGVQRPLAMVTADPVKLVRALETLLTSSIRSSEAGGRIELLVDLQAEYVVITLSHEAPGHSRDVLRSLFDTPPAKRVKRRFTEQRAALGLAYARGIVKAHHGTFRLEADQKGRSSVIISIPVFGRAKLRTGRKPIARGDKKMSAGG
jgi:K+-sensing histidine kinase KdpD